MPELCFRCHKSRDECSCDDGGVWFDVEDDGPDEPEVAHYPSHHSEVPADAMINAHVCADQYVDDEGRLRFAVHFTGDVPMTQYVGLLEIAKSAIMGAE